MEQSKIECPECGEDRVCSDMEEYGQILYCPKCNIRFYPEIDPSGAPIGFQYGPKRNHDSSDRTEKST